jgi:hypothetical protein
MRSCPVEPCKPTTVRIAFVAFLTMLSAGWTTCTAIVNFNSCPGTVPQPQIISLSPDSIPDNMESVPLTVNGDGFVAQSQILWNGRALPTTFTGPRQLQATITQQTLDSFGSSVGDTVQISVMSPGSSSIVGCPNGGSSATLVLLIN